MRIRYLQNTDQILENSALLLRQPEHLKGQWKDLHPDADAIHLEIGCGKGHYIGEMSKKHPEILYLGVEKISTILARSILNIEGDVLHPEDERVIPYNLRLIRRDALELDACFEDHEIDRIYLNFPDPWPKDRHAKRRLTSDRFLPLYARWLAPGGQLHMKTDNTSLFRWSLEQLEAGGWQILFQSDDWHAEPESAEDVRTEYEIQFSSQGKKIHKLTAMRIC